MADWRSRAVFEDDAAPVAAPVRADWRSRAVPDVEPVAAGPRMGPFQPDDSEYTGVGSPEYINSPGRVFARNARNAFFTGGTTGLAVNALSGGMAYTPREARTFNAAEFTPFMADPIARANEQVAAAAGQVAGSIPHVETFFAPAKLTAGLSRIGAKGLQALSRFAPNMAARIAGSTAARRAALEAGENVVMNTATDPVIQGGNIGLGVQEEYNPVQTAMAPAIGLVAGGGIGGARGLAQEAATNRAARDAGEKLAAGIMAATQDQPLALPSPAMVPPAPMSEAEINLARARINRGQSRGAGQDVQEPPDVIFGGAEGGMTRDDIAAAREANRVYSLPAPDQVTPRMSEAEINIAQARMNRGQRGGEGQEPAPEAPDILAGGEGRAPRTRDDVQGQREAAEAFRVAEAQRARLAETPDTFDTQAAGRPQGVGAENVYLDQDFPVRIIERRFVPDTKGGGVEVARVERYDPRTGQADPEAVEYEIPVRQLRRSAYAAQPRQAQEFTARAEGPRPPEQPRMPDQETRLEPEQTFRATAPDNNTDFPGAGEGRSPLPEQPEGPGPYRNESEAEAAFKAAEERRARGEQARAEREEQARAEDAYKGKKASNAPKGKDKTGNWHTDDFGYVRSDKGGPIKFGDQKQAAKWIIKQGQKDTDQLFDIAVHPGGAGYTAKLRGMTARASDVPPGPKTAPEPPPGRRNPPPRLAGPESPDQQPSPRPPGDEPPPPPSPSGGGEAVRAPGADWLRRGNLKRVPLTLAGYLRKRGGLKDLGGDLAGIGVKDNRRLRGLVNNTRGIEMDRALEGLIQDGWLPRGAKINDLLELLRREAQGRKVYHPESDRRAAEVEQEKADAEADFQKDAVDDINGVADGMRIRLSADEVDDILRNYWNGDSEAAVADYLEDMARRHEQQLTGKDDGDEQQGPPGDDTPDGGSPERPAVQRGAEGRDTGDDQGSASGASAARAKKDVADDGLPFDAPEESAADMARRNQDKRMKGSAPQKSADFGLFDADNERSLASQGNIFDETDDEILDRMWGGGRKGTFYSNPFADPALLYDGIIKPVMGWSKKAFTDYMDDIRETLGLFAEGKGAKSRMLSTSVMTPVLREARALHNLVFHTTSQRMRTIARIFDSETAQKVADIFDATGRKGVGETFDAALNRVRTQRQNQVVKILGDMAAKPKKFQKDLEQITRMIRSGARVNGKLGQQADQLRELLAQHLKYLREAGIEVGETKNYFPRMPDMNKVLRDKEGFVRQATAFFKAEFKLGSQQAEEAARDWLGKITTGYARSSIEDFAPDATLPKTRHTKGRVLSGKVEDFMQEYLVNDPVDALMQYFNSTTRHAEWARRMGADLSKWNDMKAKMKAEGVSEDGINKIGNLAAVSAGMPSFSYIPHSAVNLLNWMKVTANLGALEKAMFSSIPELIVPGLKTGNPGLIFMSVKDALEQMAPGGKIIKSIRDKEDFAEDMGLIQEGMRDAAIMAARSAQLDNPSRAQNFIQSKFFHTNYLEQFTRATRVAAGNVSRVMLRKYARDVARGGMGAKSAAQRLQEWGVPAADVDTFSRWLMNTQAGMPGVMDMTGKNGEYYRTAVHRIVDQSIMRPNASTKPVWANDPLGGLVFQLQAYSYAFHQNILMPALTDAMKGADPRAQLDALDRARMIAPAAFLALLPLMQYYVGDARDQLFGDKEWMAKQEKADEGKPGWAKSTTMRAFSRGGGFGKYDALFNTLTAARFRKKFVESQTGVAVNYMTRLADSLSNLFFNNSPGTVTTEENVAEAMYQLFIEPSVAAGISILTPSALRPAGFAALQAAGAKELQKKAFVKPVAGALATARGTASVGAKPESAGSPWN